MSSSSRLFIESRSLQFVESRTNLVGFDQFSALRSCIAFVDLGCDLVSVLGQPGFLFVEHRDRVFDKLVDGLIRAALNVLADQGLEFGTKANLHADILRYRLAYSSERTTQ